MADIPVPYTVIIYHPIHGNRNVTISHEHSDDRESLDKDIISSLAMDIYSYCNEHNMEITSYDHYKQHYFADADENVKNNSCIDVYGVDYFYNDEWNTWSLHKNKDLIYESYLECRDDMHLALLNNYTLMSTLVEKNEPYIQEIRDAIQKEDLESFQSVYKAYLSDDTKYGYFHFDEQIPSSYYTRNYYKLCSCPEECKSANFMYKVHRHHFMIPCNCQNGKRYSVLLKAYIHRLKKMGYEGAYFSYTIHDILDAYKVDNTNEHLLNDAIIQYIQSDGKVDLHYREWNKVEMEMK